MKADNAAKVIMIGDSGVGKTSIVTSKEFSTFDVNVPPTVAVSTTTTSIQLKDRVVDIKIWDTAGQEQYSSLIPMFSRDAKVCVVTCDITKQSSIDHVGNWIKMVEEGQNVRPAIVIAVNKIDLEKQTQKTRSEIVQELAPKCRNIVFVSALTRENIDDLFILVAKEAAEQMKAKEGRTRAAPVRNESSGCSC